MRPPDGTEREAPAVVVLVPGLGLDARAWTRVRARLTVDAATRSPRVAGLVLIGPVTDPGARSWPRMIGQWVRTAAHEHLWEVPLLAPQYLSTRPSSMVRGMNQMRHYRTHAGLASLSVPTFVIRGQRDRIAAPAWCARLAQSAAAEVISVPGAAHMVPLTHPEVVAACAERLRPGATPGPEDPAEPGALAFPL